MPGDSMEKIENACQEGNRVCLRVIPRTEQAKKDIGRSYSEKTLDIMRTLGATSYIPRTSKGELIIGNACEAHVTPEFLCAMERDGFSIERVNCRSLPKLMHEMQDL